MKLAICLLALLLLAGGALFAQNESVREIADEGGARLSPEEVGVPANMSLELSQEGASLKYKVSLRDRAGADANGLVRVIIRKGDAVLFASDRENITGSLEGSYPLSGNGTYEVAALEDTRMLSANAQLAAEQVPGGGGAGAGDGGEAEAEPPTSLSGFNIVILTVLVLIALLIAYMVWKRRRKRRG